MKNCIYIFTVNRKTVSKKAREFVLKISKDELGINKNPSFAFLENGKPYLKEYPDFHFNISHSDDLVAVAFSNTPVGVDIEKLRDVNLKIAKRYFAEDEKQFVKDSESFFYVWTRKEALLKQTGEGIRKELSSFSVLENKNIKTIKQDNYILSVCSVNAESFTVL